ncbi:hypothetical protein MCETHM1_01294 [Flavobacteriaceae bacterium]
MPFFNILKINKLSFVLFSFIPKYGMNIALWNKIRGKILLIINLLYEIQIK